MGCTAVVVQCYRCCLSVLCTGRSRRSVVPVDARRSQSSVIVRGRAVGELRQNLATREWVIIASERFQRPHEFAMPPEYGRCHLPEWDESCPFCPGNEESDLEVLRLPQAGEWQVRVVNNRYPALAAVGDVERHFDGVHRNISGVGYHELLIHSRRHNACHATESPELVGLAWRRFTNAALPSPRTRASSKSSISRTTASPPACRCRTLMGN